MEHDLRSQTSMQHDPQNSLVLDSVHGVLACTCLFAWLGTQVGTAVAQNPRSLRHA